MPGEKEIRVTCETKDKVSIFDLIHFQGDLKTLRKEEAQKIESSILKYGLTFPGFIWRNEGKNYIIDSHQRVFVLKQLADKGWHLPADEMPVVFIDAKDRKEAKAKVLLAASRYGRIDESGLADFFMEAGLDLKDLLPAIDLPDIFGLSAEEVEPPALSQGDREHFQQMTFTLHDEQVEEINAAIDKAKESGAGENPINENSNGNALAFIAQRFVNG